MKDSQPKWEENKSWDMYVSIIGLTYWKVNLAATFLPPKFHNYTLSLFHLFKTHFLDVAAVFKKYQWTKSLINPVNYKPRNDDNKEGTSNTTGRLTRVVQGSSVDLELLCSLHPNPIEKAKFSPFCIHTGLDEHVLSIIINAWPWH